MRIRARMSMSADGCVTTPALPGGAVEIVCFCEGSRGDLPGKPAEQV